MRPRYIQFAEDSATLPFSDSAGSGQPENRILLGDCLDILPRLELGTLQTIYLDPPFGTGQKKSLRDVSYTDKVTDTAEYIRWLEPILSHSRDLLTATGSLFLHLDHRSVHYAKVCLDTLFGHKNFINEIIWCYSVGGKSRRRFARKHDTILWFAKSKNYAFYPQAIRVPRKGGSHMRVRKDENGVSYQEKTDKKTGKVYRYPIAEGKIPEDWWTDIPTLNHSDRERVGWPTQKPMQLLERIILATTQPGDRVGDWFAGSGTTAATAISHNRYFTTIDASKEALSRVETRLQKVGQTLISNGQTPPSTAIISPDSDQTGGLLPVQAHGS